MIIERRNMRFILSGSDGVALLTGGGAAQPPAAADVSNLISDRETEYGEQGLRKTPSCSHRVTNGTLTS